MQRLLFLTSLVLFAVLAIGCEQEEDGQLVESLRLMVGEDLGCGCDGPDMYEPLNGSIESFEAESGIHVELVRSPPGTYERRLWSVLASDQPPDVMWVGYEMVIPLVEQGFVVPLDEWVAQRPETMPETAEWAREALSYGGELYGVPVGDSGEACLDCYMVTAAAQAGGRADAAFDLIAHLRSEVPRRGLPDLAMEELTFSTEGPTAVEQGEDVVVNAVLRNVGDAPADGARVIVELDEVNTLIDQTVEHLEAGAEERIEFVLDPQEPGPHHIAAFVDPDALVFESNELNNRVAEDFEVVPYAGTGGSGPPPAPKALSLPFCIDTSAYRTSVWGMGPKVAFDGTNYLVVWAKQQPLKNAGYNHELRAARISPTGTILDSGGFVVAAKLSKYNAFNLAFDGTNFLVVWEEEVSYTNDPSSIIAAARVSTHGTLLDTTPIAIDDSPTPGWKKIAHEAPDVFFDGSAFVVVYRDLVQWNKPADLTSENGVFAKRVSTAGAVLAGKTKLVGFSQTMFSWRRQRAAYNQGEGFLAFVRGDPTTSHPAFDTGVSGVWVTVPAAGPAATAPQAVAGKKGPSGGLFDDPAIASAGPGHYLVAWADEQNTVQNYPEIHGAIVGPSGGFVSYKGALVTGVADQFPAVAFDGTNYVVVYRHAHGFQHYPGAVRVTTEGVVGPTTYFKTLVGLVFEVDVAFGTTNGLVVFENYNIPCTCTGPACTARICALLIDRSP